MESGLPGFFLSHSCQEPPSSCWPPAQPTFFTSFLLHIQEPELFLKEALVTVTLCGSSLLPVQRLCCLLPGWLDEGVGSKASAETDPRFKYRQVTREPPQASKGTAPTSFHSPRRSHQKTWGLTPHSAETAFSSQVLLRLKQVLVMPSPIPRPPPLLALLHSVPSVKHRTQGSRAPLPFSRASQGLPVTFLVLPPLTAHRSPPCFPSPLHPSSRPVRLLSVDFLARPELEDANSGPRTELVPNTF